MNVGLASQPDFLLRLYQAAREQPAGRFEDTALGALEHLLRFDAAFWGTGRLASVHGISLLGAHLHRMPVEHLGAWQASFVNDTLALRPGARGRYSFARVQLKDAKSRCVALGVLARRVPWDEALIAAHLSPDACVQWITFYRQHAREACLATERRHAAQLTPHLFEARAISYALQSQHLLGSQAAEGLAFCDRRGVPVHADVAFIELLGSEWPGWPGGRLPGGLVELCRTGGEATFMGSRIRVDARRAGDVFGLLARRRALADLLSPREREVVSHFVDGQSYKSIAKALAIAPATVRNQIASAYGKLGAHNKIELRRIVDRGPGLALTRSA
jgi:DNA-binding CsgD family transcriptional regulator